MKLRSTTPASKSRKPSRPAAKNTWDIVRLLEKINKYGTTVLLTTHNADIVNKLKRRVITIEAGKISSDQAEGSYRQ